MRQVTSAAVLGSGVMGGAIAAHLANCGLDCLLLDVADPDASDPEARSRLARSNREALVKRRPAPLYLPEMLERIKPGNFEDHIEQAAACDWIIEAVTEDAAIKHELFSRLARCYRPGTVVSTNTSGISIQSLASELPDSMRPHFLGVHFFNPPRYMKLVEVIPSSDTDPRFLQDMAAFLEKRLGKGVVFAKDTPNFIANRLLTFAFCHTVEAMQRYGLTVEEVDAVTGPLAGHASSATFRTADLIGLDTLGHVIENVAQNCPDDASQWGIRVPDIVARMVEKGLLGEKTGQGFYKATNERDARGKRVILTLDWETLEYREPVPPSYACLEAARSAASLEERLRIMHGASNKAEPDTGADFAWDVFAHTAAYAAGRIPEVADDIVRIDRAVRWGLGWEVGLFETWDALGFADTCRRIEAAGIALPPLLHAMRDAGAEAFYKETAGARHYFDMASGKYQPEAERPGVLHLGRVKAARGAVEAHSAASLVDLGDGILCMDLHGEHGLANQETYDVLEAALNRIEGGGYDGLVIASDGPQFCGGMEMRPVLALAEAQDWDALDAMVRRIQGLHQRVRFSPKPVVAALHGACMDVGIELALHAAARVIAGETRGSLAGLAQGLVPAFGGCKELLQRACAFAPAHIAGADPFPHVRHVFEILGKSMAAGSGPEYRKLGFGDGLDPIVPGTDHVLQRAKDHCRALVMMEYGPPPRGMLPVLGESAYAAFRAEVYNLKLGGFATGHDAHVAELLGRVLTGGNRPSGAILSEQAVLDLEREAYIELLGVDATRQRLRHWIETGKPLRN